MRQSTEKPSRSAAKTFPLNLTPFEHYMLWDDRPEYPMTFVVQLRLKGSINKDAFEAALQPALRRHPLLQAGVARAKGNRDCWVTPESPTVELHWAGLETPVQPADGESIDLRKNVGLRVWIRHNDEEVVITTQFHHATCDGIGSYQFIGDWLWHYAQATSDQQLEPLPDVDPTALRSRTKASYDPANYFKNGDLDDGATKRFGFQCLRNTLAVAKPGKHIPPGTSHSEEMFPGIREFEFDKDEYKQLRHVAQDRGQSANELLIERLLVTLKDWNSENRRGRNGTICVMMPMDLREPETRLPTAANLVTYAMIRRKASECIESESLIDSIRQEMVHLKHQRHRTPFMNLIAYLRKFPTGAVRWLAGHRRLATAIVSNTGDPTKRFNVAFPKERGLLRIGNLLLTDITGVPPMRSGTRMTVSIFTYRRALKISMRCDPHHFTPSQTQVLLDRYVDRIKSLIPQSD